MNIEEAKLYLEHTSKDDFNLEEHQKENRYQAIQVVLKEIERLNDIIEKDKVLIKEANDRGYSEFEENVKLVNENSGLKFENRRLHSIIYELKIKFYETFRITQNGSYTITETDYKDIEELLDKVEGDK